VDTRDMLDLDAIEKLAKAEVFGWPPYHPRSEVANCLGDSGDFIEACSPDRILTLLALARAGRRLVPYAKAYMDLRLEDEDAGTPPEGPPDEAECAAALAAFREADGG